MSKKLNLFSTWASSFDMFCATTRFCSCFVCQRWRRQPQAKPADHDDKTAAVHRRPPRWNTEMIVHNVAKTPLKWWKSQHRLQGTGKRPWLSWLSPMCRPPAPGTTDSADAYFGTYTDPAQTRISTYARRPCQSRYSSLHKAKMHISGIWTRCCWIVHGHLCIRHIQHLRILGQVPGLWTSISLTTGKCFHMLPLKPGAHIQVDVFVFTDMLARGQARGFGQWKPRLMSFPTIMPHSHWVHGTKLACNIHIGIKFRAKNGTKFFCSTTLSCPSSLATSRWKWHCICLCHSGTVRSAVPHCDLRWSFPWCSSRRPSPDHTWCIQRHHFGCSLRKNHRSPCRGPWTPDTLTNEGNAGGSWWIWIWHCVTWSAKELRMTKISMLRSQWHSSGSLWPPLPWKERRIQNAHACFDNISEMFLLLWVSACCTNMTNPMISELFLSFEVLPSWSSNAPAVGPELRRTCLIEYASTSVAGTRLPNTDKHAETATCVSKQH